MSSILSDKSVKIASTSRNFYKTLFFIFKINIIKIKLYKKQPTVWFMPGVAFDFCSIKAVNCSTCCEASIWVTLSLLALNNVYNKYKTTIFN